MTIKCIVVDDEPLAREGLGEYISEVDFLEQAGEFNRAIDALNFLQQESVDLIFLDINMPKMSGLEFAKTLQSPPVIVFTTAYREFAVDSYELNGFDYLVKPITLPRFLQTCDKVREHFTSTPSKVIESFFIKEDGKFVKILFDDIYCVEGYKDYVKIHLEQNSHLALMSLKSANDRLPAANFLRVHKSFIVAKDKVNSIEGNQLLIGDRKVPISKSLKDQVFNEIVGDNIWKRK